MAIVSHETEVVRCLEDFRDAYQARDVERMVALFADDAEFTLAPGTFRGKDAIRKVLSWDARLSPAVAVRDTGIGLLIVGRTAVREQVISSTVDGVPYDEEAVTIVELDDDNRIYRYRSYYDKLGMMDDIASRYPGAKGWIFRKLTGYLVAQGRKGLDA